MKRVRFIAPARREFIAEVVYYNDQEQGLGARFAAAVEAAHFPTRRLAGPKDYTARLRPKRPLRNRLPS